MADNKVGIEFEVDGDAKIKLREISDESKNLANVGQKSFIDFSKAFDIAAGVITAQAVVGVFNSITGAIGSFAKSLVVDGVKAAQEEQEAVNQLNVALATTGKFSEGTSERLQQFADSLEETTRFSGEAILKTEAYIQALGQLDEDGLKQATAAALDLSAATGKDLTTATELVAKAAAGEVGAFKKLGVTIREGKTDAETFSNAMQVLNSRFGGAAQSAVNTFAGAQNNLNNQWESFTKVIGRAIIENSTIIEVMKEIGKIVAEFTNTLGGNEQALKKLVAGGVIITIEALRGLILTGDVLYRSFIIIFESLKTGFFAIGAAASKVLSIFSDEQAKVFDYFAAKADESANAVGDAMINQSGLGEVDKLLQRIGDSATTGLGKIIAGADAATPSLTNAANATRGLSSETEKAIEANNRFLEGVIQSSLTQEEKLNADLAKLQEINLQKGASEQLLHDARIALNEQLDLAKQQSNEKEINDLLAKNELMAQIDAEKYASQIAANQNAINQKLSMEQAGSNAVLQNEKRVADARKKVEQDRANATVSVLNALQTLQTSKIKSLGAVAKAAAITQAVIDTYKGATSAAAAVAGIPFAGPFLAAAAAAAFIAAGIVRINAIRSQQFQHGIDTVPGIGNRDSVPALLAPGERVVPKNTNQDLKSFLNNGGALATFLESIDEKIGNLSNTFIVRVGEKEIVNVLRDAQLGGRVLAT